MHEKIHVNPRFLNPSQSVNQNVHFNPHFVGQTASRKQNSSSVGQPSDPRAKNVTILPPTLEDQHKITPSHLPPTPANVKFGGSIARSFNDSHRESSNLPSQRNSNSLQHFDAPNNVSTSYSHCNPFCSTSTYNSTSAYNALQHGTSVYYSSGSESKHLQNHSSQINPVISYGNVEAGNFSADSLSHEHIEVNSKTNVFNSYQSQSENLHVLSVANDSANMNSITPSHSTIKSSDVKMLSSSKVPSTCFINPKFIKKPLSSESSGSLLGGASNKDAPFTHNVCSTASRQSGSGTGQRGEVVHSAYVKHSSSKPSENCNLPTVLSKTTETKEKVGPMNNLIIADIVSKENYNRLFNKDSRNDATCDPNSVFVNPQFLKHANNSPNQKVIASTSCINETPQSGVIGNVETDSRICRSVPVHIPVTSISNIISQTSIKSGTDLEVASQTNKSDKLTELVKNSLIAQPLVSNIHKNSWPTSNRMNAFNKDACSFSGNWTSSGSTAVYVNRNTLIRSSKYTTTKQCFIKPTCQIDTPNMKINKELRPVMVSTRNKLIRKRSNSSSSGILNKQASAGCSKLNLSLKNKYLTTISPKLRAQKYSFISRSKLVKCATNNLNRRKMSPVKSHWPYRSLNKISSFSKSNVELYGTINRKVVPKVVSNYSSRGGINDTKKSDHFVRIGESMYKSTATSLKRQLPARAVSTRGTLSTTNSPTPSGRRWHSGTSWSRCWVTDRKARSAAVVFPSLHSFRISNTNYAHQRSKPYNLSARKKQYCASYSTRQQTALTQRRFSSAMSITNKPKLCNSKRLVLAAHAEKAQMLQRLIIAAKQRSVYILQRKAARKNIALPLPVETQLNTSQQKQRLSTQTVPGGGTSPGGLTKVPYCRFYHRFGRCFRGTACPYEHNPNRVAICTRFLRGRCHVPKCLFAHTLDKGRMPVCSHFLRDALCTRPQCPYLHVNPNPKAPICEDFLHGHCDKREKCKLQHVLECAEYRETGRCPRAGRCPLPHPTRRPTTSALRQNSSSSKKGRSKIKRPRTVSVGSGEGVLGAPATKRKRETKPKKKVLARYFKSDETAPDEGSATETSADAGTTSTGARGSTMEEQCRTQLKVKKQRIMSLIEKMKSRAGNSDLLGVTPPSFAAGKGKTPVLNSGKYKLVDDEDVIFVQPIVEYSADLSLPSFIPVSLTFSLARPSTVPMPPPHLQVQPSLPLGSLEQSAPVVRAPNLTETLSSPSVSGKQTHQNMVDVSQLSLTSKKVTLLQSTSLPLRTKPVTDPSDHSVLSSCSSLGTPPNAASSQDEILTTNASSTVALESTSKIYASHPHAESFSCYDDSSKTIIPVSLHVSSTVSPPSPVVDINPDASMES